MRAAVQALACLLLAPFAGVTLVGAAAAISQPISVDYAEPVVYVHAARILRGEPLYQPIDQLPFTVAAYPPLYYWAAAALQQSVGPGFAPGRVLSLACGLGAAVCVAYLAAGRNRDRSTPVLAALLFLALAFPGDVPWLGLYRVDMLGILLSLASVVVLARGLTRERGTGLASAAQGMNLYVLVAAVLAGLALLTKQTFFAAAVAGALSLCLQDRWSALRFGVVAAVTFGLPSVWLEATTHAFVSNTVVANISPFTTSTLQELGREFVRTQGAPILLAMAYAATARPWTNPEGSLLLIYWVTSAVSLLGIAKVGANYNYWIELAAVTSALAARYPSVIGTAWCASKRKLAAALAALIGLVILVGTASLVPRAIERAVFNVEAVRYGDDYSHFEALVERVRLAPGAVLAEPLDVLALSGRSVLLEPFVYSLLLESGQWDPAPLIARICNGQVVMVVLGYSIDDAASMGVDEYTLWPPAILSAIEASMAFETMAAGRFIYTHRGHASQAASGSSSSTPCSTPSAAAAPRT